MSNPTEFGTNNLPDLDRIEKEAHSILNSLEQGYKGCVRESVRDILEIVAAARRAQPEGEAPQAEPAQYVISVQDAFEMLEKERPGRRMKVQSREPNLGCTEDRVQALAEKLADASAKNAGVARQLTFPHIYLGLKDALLASMPRWLSTADSMPSEDGALLVVFDPSNSPTIWTAVWNKEHACFDSHGGWFERNEVTHWMPLPAAPASTLSPLCGAQQDAAPKKTHPNTP